VLTFLVVAVVKFLDCARLTLPRSLLETPPHLLYAHGADDEKMKIIMSNHRRLHDENVDAIWETISAMALRWKKDLNELSHQINNSQIALQKDAMLAVDHAKSLDIVLGESQLKPTFLEEFLSPASGQKAASSPIAAPSAKTGRPLDRDRPVDRKRESPSDVSTARKKPRAKRLNYDDTGPEVRHLGNLVKPLPPSPPASEVPETRWNKEPFETVPDDVPGRVAVDDPHPGWNLTDSRDYLRHPELDPHHVQVIMRSVRSNLACGISLEDIRKKCALPLKDDGEYDTEAAMAGKTAWRTPPPSPKGVRKKKLKI
jgi:hypothetical protein